MVKYIIFFLLFQKQLFIQQHQIIKELFYNYFYNKLLNFLSLFKHEANISNPNNLKLFYIHLNLPHLIFHKRVKRFIFLYLKISGKNYNCKIVLVGESGVGKSSIINQYVKHQMDLSLQSTIGVAFMHKKVQIQDNTYNLQIYDTSGQERFNSIVPQYYQRANFCFIVFDLTDMQSFERLTYWEQQLKENSSIQRVVLANKSDLTDKYVIEDEKIQQWCQQHNLHYYKVSALTGQGIEEAFNDVLQKYSWQEIEPESDLIKGQTNQKKCC